MPDPHDPLRSLFSEAAASGRARAEAPPVGRIVERGRRAHRRRVAALAAGACLALAGGGAATAVLLPGERPPATPATSPATSPSGSPTGSETAPARTPRPPSTAFPTFPDDGATRPSATSSVPGTSSDPAVTPTRRSTDGTSTSPR
ncbi:hypothetical protein [Streptomyces sp. NPDC059175]|uniref:hypothetical protein n=1 Tax=unclassified Streptomyces TaxID=2593676 RepID=UPI0036D1A261